MDKISIVVDKNLSTGQKANTCAIIMGQLALCNNSIYAKEIILDKNGIAHASIMKNVVVLDGGKGQLLNLSLSLKTSVMPITYSVFTETGQRLSNSFDEYRKNITQVGTEETGIIGIGLYGDADDVNKFTKKFSLTK